LRKVGYKPQTVAFVPVSARHGDNLLTESRKYGSAVAVYSLLLSDDSYRMSWYTGWSRGTNTGVVKGTTLLDVIDTVQPPGRLSGKPLRLPVQDVYNIGGESTVVVGRIETGVIKPGMVVQFAPSHMITEVRSVEMHHERLEIGLPGDIVGFNVG